MKESGLEGYKFSVSWSRLISGVLKITPTHDLNDFEVGNQHQLEFVSILTYDGRIISHRGLEFEGMPRFKARIAVLEALQEKHTTVKPLGVQVLVKIKSAEEKITGVILLLTTTQTKPQIGELVEIGDGKTIGKIKVYVSIQTESQIVYSKYVGTELELNGNNRLILKEDDIVGILDSNDVKDLKPLNDRVLVKVVEVEEKTAGGLLLTETTKEKPSI